MMALGYSPKPAILGWHTVAEAKQHANPPKTKPRLFFFFFFGMQTKTQTRTKKSMSKKMAAKGSVVAGIAL